MGKRSAIRSRLGPAVVGCVLTALALMVLAACPNSLLPVARLCGSSAAGLDPLTDNGGPWRGSDGDGDRG